MKKSALSIILLLSLVLIAVACGSSEEQTRENKADYAEEEAAGTMTSGWSPELTVSSWPSPESGDYDDETAHSTVGESWAGERLIVRNAILDMTVDDVIGAVERISQLATQAEGYVVSSKDPKGRVPRACPWVNVAVAV